MMDYTINRNTLRKVLNLPEKIPKSLSGEYPNIEVPLGWWREDRRKYRMKMNVKLVESPKKLRKSSQHRIFVQCPTCSKWIPAGRFHQHYKVHIAPVYLDIGAGI